VGCNDGDDDDDNAPRRTDAIYGVPAMKCIVGCNDGDDDGDAPRRTDAIDGVPAMKCIVGHGDDDAGTRYNASTMFNGGNYAKAPSRT
jgi:hypothetical protein